MNRGTGRAGHTMSRPPVVNREISWLPFNERALQEVVDASAADVIVHAADVYLSVMKWGRITRMYVPRVGLSDGIVHLVYDRYQRRAARP